MDNLTKDLLEKISGLHSYPAGAVLFRKNGKNEILSSSENIQIEKKDDMSGINIFVRSKTNGETCHFPVIVTENDYLDFVRNDFFIQENAVVTIIAGCGVHSSGNAGHDGIHTFHLGKNCKVTYVENHFATGEGKNKSMNPTTNVILEEGAQMIMNTMQIGGVDFSKRKIYAKLKKNSFLEVNEKILTDRFNVAKTEFKVELAGENSKCVVVSKSVAKGESEQVFKSNLVGKNDCFGRVECDAILLDNARVIGEPKISAMNKHAMLSHEASVGKIAKDQLIKLMTLGLDERKAEEKIIEGFFK